NIMNNRRWNAAQPHNVVSNIAGGNEAQRSDRMELPTHSDDEWKCRVFRQVEAVTALPDSYNNCF
ncbi:MAG: hypothetical protein LBC02_02555, partial [Planctomycetaceae bacterium]|nr:hypothetical protein [Planctomycetaceae bacterium]